MTSSNVMTTNIPIACSLTDPERARRGETVAQSLFSAVVETRDLPDGYAFRFPAETVWLAPLFEFVSAERECCPFFQFEIVAEPGQGPIWLNLRGGEGVKEFVETTFLSHTNPGEEP